MAYIVTACIVVAYAFMACTVVAYVVMAGGGLLEPRPHDERGSQGSAPALS